MSRTALIVTFDRLPCAALGCYGNEWIDTPGFDALAAEGFVFDHHMALQVRGDDATLTATPRLAAGWITALRQTGVQTTLLHEPHSELTIDPLAFDLVQDCGGQDGLGIAAGDLPFARLVRRATELMTQGSSADRLLWLSSAGLPDVCRPPQESLDLYLEEFATHDIDWEALSPEEFGRQPAIRAAYLSFLDHWLGQLHVALSKLEGPVLLMVVGCEGLLWQPVPRRQPIPGGLEIQRTESPWLMWANDGSVTSGRSSALVQLSDLPPTIVEWWSHSSLGSLTDGGVRSGLDREPSLWPILRGERATHRDTVVTQGTDGARCVRTATESVVFASDDVGSARAFLKPEDLWDVNDVATSLPDVVAQSAAWVAGTAKKEAGTVADAGRSR